MGDTKHENWKVPDTDDERTFALEEDPTFGAGDLESAPPAEDGDLSWSAIAAEAFESAGRTGGDQPIPRVTINAFCDRPDVATAIEAAAGDRRLAKAIVHVATGGIEAALTSLASQASPNPDHHRYDRAGLGPAPRSRSSCADRRRRHESGDRRRGERYRALSRIDCVAAFPNT